MDKLKLFEKLNAPKKPKPPKKNKKDADEPPRQVPKPEPPRPFPLTLIKTVPSKRLFEEKQILVVGNGDWGKALIGEGAERVVSVVDTVPVDKKLSDDRKNLFLEMPEGEFPYPDGVFDTVFLYDCLSRSEQPDALLSEIVRVTAPSGMICIGQTPYTSPHGSGLDDVIRMPFGHLLFDKKTVIRACAKAYGDLPAPEKKKKMRFVTRKELNGKVLFLPKKRGITTAGMKKLASESGCEVKSFGFRPIEKGICPTLTKIPGIRSYTTDKYVVILEKKNAPEPEKEEKKERAAWN